MDEVQKEMLKNLQKDYMESARETQRKKQMVEHFIKRHTIDIFKPVPSAGLVNRDVHIVKEFLRTGTKTSKEIMDHLNEKLRSQPNRWETYKCIDANRFMGSVGNYLEMELDIKKFKDDESDYRGYSWRLI